MSMASLRAANLDISVHHSTHSSQEKGTCYYRCFFRIHVRTHQLLHRSGRKTIRFSSQATFKYALLSGRLDEPERVTVSENTLQGTEAREENLQTTQRNLGGRGGGSPRGRTIQGEGTALVEDSSRSPLEFRTAHQSKERIDRPKWGRRLE